MTAEYTVQGKEPLYGDVQRSNRMPVVIQLRNEKIIIANER